MEESRATWRRSTGDATEEAACLDSHANSATTGSSMSQYAKRSSTCFLTMMACG
jgi:hypothetical protein